MINIRGKGSVGIAISYYSLRGMVSIPLEPCDYNILFDKEGQIYKIKVISCSFKSPYGIYSASLRTMGGHTYKDFDAKTCDYVFIVTDDLNTYEIPSKEIKSKRQISLNVYEKYKVSLNLIPD